MGSGWGHPVFHRLSTLLRDLKGLKIVKREVETLGHVHVDAYVKGAKGGLKLEKVLVDRGATYTMLSIEVLDNVGAIKTPYIIELELGDGRKVEAEVYVVAIKINDREGPAIIATFKDVKRVLGIQTLESLGLRVDPSAGRLEPTRPKGVAYFY